MSKALIKQTAELILNSDSFDMRVLKNCIMGHYVEAKWGKKTRAKLAEADMDSYEFWHGLRPQIAKDFGFKNVRDLKYYPLFQLSIPTHLIRPVSRKVAAAALIQEFT